MAQVRDTVHLHPETVTKGEELAKERKPRKRPKRSKVTILSWDDISDERVRERARLLAENNRKRVEILSPSDVIVHNHPNWKKADG